MPRFFLISLPLAFSIVAACGSSDNISKDARPFSGIAEDEAIIAVGTEPFWSIEISGNQAFFSAPDLAKAQPFEVSRFAGNNGLGFSGDLPGNDLRNGKLNLTITPGECSDGMSDTVFPYTATMTIGNDVMTGCAHTDRQKPSGQPQP